MASVCFIEPPGVSRCATVWRPVGDNNEKGCDIRYYVGTVWPNIIFQPCASAGCCECVKNIRADGGASVFYGQGSWQDAGCRGIEFTADENHMPRDVARVIADALQRSHDEGGLDGGLQPPRIFHGMRQQATQCAGVFGIHLLVLLHD